MKKEFNITGVCVPEMHYMVDTTQKIENVLELIEKRKYFSINRPRQYGKTTTFFNLFKELQKSKDFICAEISFEGIGVESYKNAELFIPQFLNLLIKVFKFNKLAQFVELTTNNKNISTLDELSDLITNLCLLTDKKLVLLIDEVDKSMNNQLFLDFLAMLRNKYLNQSKGIDTTFYSVVLAGVHDVKTLKLKIRPDEEQRYNSPWNIAADFTIDMSFNPQEISTMLFDYTNDKKVEMDIPAISQRIYHYTSGYPFLVSKICKEIDEKLLPLKNKLIWETNDIDLAVKDICQESNTNFDSLIKNIIEHKELEELTKKIILGSQPISFFIGNPTINLGYTYGIFDKNKNGTIKIHNKIYEEIITEYVISRMQEKEEDNRIAKDVVKSSFLFANGKLNFEKVLLKFQEVIKEKYSKSDVLKSDEFLEKDLRLLFLVFLKPILNGVGFSFKEVETSEEKRLDIVVIFEDEKFIVELKIWRGEEYHLQGIERLKDYMRRENANKSYMLIMDKNRHKEFTTNVEDDILMVWI